MPPIGTDVVGVKPRVTGTDVLPAKRLEDTTANETADTCPMIDPEVTGKEAAVSADV